MPSMQRKSSSGFSSQGALSPENGPGSGEPGDVGYGDMSNSWRAQSLSKGGPEAPVMRHAHADAADAVEPTLTGGFALPDTLACLLEGAFGWDFSHVRVHTDAAAAEDASCANADAFAKGAHLFFAAGMWAPGTAAGLRLLIHELCHVVQFDQGQLSAMDGVSSPSDGAERDADRCEAPILERLASLGSESVASGLAPVSAPRGGGAATAPVMRQQAADPGDREKARKKIDKIMKHIAEGRWDVDDLAVELTAKDMRYLTHDERVKIITTVGEGWYVPRNEEKTLILLIQTSPNPRAILSALQSNDAALLRTLIGAINTSEHKGFHELLRKLSFSIMSPGQASRSMDSAKVFPWADPGLIGSLYNVRFYYDTCELTKDGKLRVKYWTNFWFVGKEGAGIPARPL